MLSDKFNNIDDFFGLKASDLEEIAEIGPVMANSIVDFFSLSQTRKLISEFKKAGLNLKAEVRRKIKTAITGKTFVFTGELDSFSRGQARQIVESLGGKWVSSVSKATDYVIAGKNPGSKYKIAEELHLTILDEIEFKQLIQANS